MEGVHGTHKASKLASEDVISSMPDNVITNIMNRLPIRDALRTGILARNWRFKWTLLTQLVFDCWNPVNEGTLVPKGKKFDDSRIISRLLLLLKGPVTKFDLGILSDQILDVGDFNHWVSFLSTKGVKEFTFKYYSETRFKLPTHLFSCLELTHLNLKDCVFNLPPTFRGFPNLLSLQLTDTLFISGNFVEFITGCPLLEIMELEIGLLFDRFKINLEDFPKLENFKKLSLKLCGIDFENTGITTSSICQFLGFFPKLEEVYLDFNECELAVEDVARKWAPTAFPCLKTLALYGIDIGSCNAVSSAFGMIWGSPNLQELRIEINLYEYLEEEFDVPPTGLFSSDLGSSTLGLLQLQSVVIKHFCGLKNEVCLIKYLLACSPLLKRIDIHWFPNLRISASAKYEKYGELLKLNRASPVAQVVCYESDAKNCYN